MNKKTIRDIDLKGKKVLVNTINNKHCRGNIIDYIPAEVNEEKGESIIVKTFNNNELIELYKNRIASIILLN